MTLIKEFHEARAILDGMVRQMLRQVETTVGNQFVEERRLEPDGVPESELRKMIIQAIRSWLPK